MKHPNLVVILFLAHLIRAIGGVEETCPTTTQKPAEQSDWSLSFTLLFKDKETMNIVFDLRDSSYDGNPEGNQGQHTLRQLPFGEEATLEDLQLKISKILRIEPEWQVLLFEGRRIGVGRPPTATLISLGLADLSWIIVKHADLDNWQTLLDLNQQLTPTTLDDPKKLLYTEVMELIKQLSESRFFAAYTKFSAQGFKIHERFSKLYDRTLENIKTSTRLYFNIIYKDQNPTITFDEKIEGTRKGCVAKIQVGGNTLVYYVKTHHGGGKADTLTGREKVDLKELYGYKLLEQLGLGAVMEFIPSGCKSKWIVFLASKAIERFQTLSYLEAVRAADEANGVESTISLNEYVKPTIQLLALYSVLDLGDYHDANMGFGPDHHPFIVDFTLLYPNRGGFATETHLFDRVRTDGATDLEINHLINRVKFNERVRIGQQFFLDLNLESAIDECLERFVTQQKKAFDNWDLVFEPRQKTENLKQYVEKIKANLETFMAYKTDINKP